MLAIGPGLAVSRTALRPVSRLTEAAEHVAATQDLSARIPTDRPDELGRLGAAFNAMLEALDRSRRQQRRLVADAGHELRTPLTTLRTNVELLARLEDMDPAERREVLEELVFELEELSTLVDELVTLAVDPSTAEGEARSVRLDEIVDGVAERTRRRTGREVVVEASPTSVRGRPGLLERAVGNLLDNACRWGPPHAPVEVRVSGGRVAVRDHGPGIPQEDRPRVFERFYRAPAARAMPGSGLGLAIVDRVVEEHGGRTWIADPEEGSGVVVGFEIPEEREEVP